ncbi:ABC transporter ATP-binding protein [Mycoplasmopsis sturni]|uniref:ABC transporter ATP-binding protein n=1 Tax=Mycoplasmopsis sturni TaxID=39047 RepID=UPI00056B86D7|nr:ABC transporter ATP-binding protein [Mycoplasmopsis sturni]
MKEIVLKIENLNKSFGNFKALNNLNFEVQKGELFGFLGVNGAGKTTTLNIIFGILKPDSGQVWINGKNAFKNQAYIKNEIGVVFQNSILDPYLKVSEILYEKALLYRNRFKEPIKDVVKKIIDEFELTSFSNKLYHQLSGGQKRRVDIARALIHKPLILFLDEPTTGLDPNSRKLVWKNLQNYREKNNLTIILTTHYMEEANNCTNVIVLQKGKILERGTVRELKTKYTETIIKIYHKVDPDLELSFKEKNLKFKYIDNHYRIYFVNTNKAHDFLIENPEMKDIELVNGDMDDVFLNIIKSR